MSLANRKDIKESPNVNESLFAEASPRVLSESYSAHSSDDPACIPSASQQPIAGEDPDSGANHRPEIATPGLTCLNDLSSHLEFISPPCEHFATRAMRVKLLKIPPNVLISCKNND